MSRQPPALLGQEATRKAHEVWDGYHVEVWESRAFLSPAYFMRTSRNNKAAYLHRELSAGTVPTAADHS
jgi:hypothetical protein